MKNKVITISRQYGSGGRTIGKRVAEELDIPCYDSELLQKIAIESGFDEGYIKEVGEYAPGGIITSVFSHGRNGKNNAEYLWQIQYKIITELAENGSCVIVGRCADYVLKDKTDLLKVFICADMDFRTKRVANVYSEEKATERYLKNKDKRRASYHRFFTNTQWGEAQNYDITLCSSSLGIDKCVEIIKNLY